MRPIINRKSQSEIHTIGNENIGLIYLEKRASISVGERLEIDEYESGKRKAQILATKLIKRIAKDKNISFSEAQELLSPSSENGVAVDNSDIVYEYAEDFAELQAISNIDGNSVAIAVATIFIRNRVAYPVNVIFDADINATLLDINPLPFPLKANSQIKFKDTSATVKVNHLSDVESITVEPISDPIADGSVGFLFTGKKYVLGSDEWTIEDTKSLDENLVSAIYEFYQNERLGWIKPPEQPATDSETEGEQLQLTGTPSTGESNPTES